MIKRTAALLLSVLLVLSLQISAFANGGIFGAGNFADTKKSYGFWYQDALIVYNGVIDDYQDFDEVYTGSVIYIPIAKADEDGNESAATDKDLKNDKVELSWKATRSPRYVVDVTVVDGKKEKIDDMPAGAYAKVELADSYAGTGSASIEVKMVLSINGLSYQETEIELACSMTNRTVIIDSDTVYSARTPTLFEVDEDYNGQVTFDVGGGVKYTTSVRAKRKHIIDYSAQADEALEERYADAKLAFHNFRGDTDSFNTIGTLEIPVEKSPDKAWLYDISSGTPKLISNAAYSKSTGKFSVQTKNLGFYMVSDTDLDEIYEEPASEPPASQPSVVEGSSVPSQPPASAADPSDPQAPPMGGDGDPPPALAGTGIGGIHAGNAAGQNPLTGTGAVLPAAAAVFALAAGSLITLWKTRKNR